MDKLSFSDMLRQAPPAVYLFRKTKYSTNIFKSKFEVVLEKSLESLFTECRTYVLFPLTRCTSEREVSDIAETCLLQLSSSSNRLV